MGEYDRVHPCPSKDEHPPHKWSKHTTVEREDGTERVYRSDWDCPGRDAGE